MSEAVTAKPAYDYLFKLKMVGDSGVGKSCLTLRFNDGVFSEEYVSTIGVDFRLKTFELEGKTIKMQTWDVGGQFRTIATHNHYKGAHGFLLVYDIADESSFDNIRQWMREVLRDGSATTVKILIGNKMDLSDKRAIKTTRGQALAEEYGMSFFECSAKTGENVYEAFTEFARQYLQIVVKETQPQPKPEQKPAEEVTKCTIS
jgi:small GTP-binding protein